MSDVAREAGIRYPVALTRSVWEACVRVPEGTGKEVKDAVGLGPTNPPFAKLVSRSETKTYSVKWDDKRTYTIQHVFHLDTLKSECIIK